MPCGLQWNPNVSMILEAILRCGLQNYKKSTGFIGYFGSFPDAPKCSRTNVSNISQSRKPHSTLSENLTLFDRCGFHFAFWTPQWSKSYRFNKVFWLTFPDAPNCSRANAFLTFGVVVKRHQLLLKNLMHFDHFGGHFAFWAPKWSKFDRFYKVFWSTFSDAPKCSRTNAFQHFAKSSNAINF